MFVNIKRFCIRIFFLIFYFGILLGWGFFSHKKINYYFVSSIGKNEDAKPLFEFYKRHIDYLVEHAGDPDTRRSFSQNEKGKHFFNIECFGEEIMKQEFVPYSEFVNYYAHNLARKLHPELKEKESIDKYVNKILKEYGTNPWAIMQSKDALTEAFKSNDVNKILIETINLAHYIGDSCVVFHCTQNYNGQLTGQEGIHAFWESTIPQQFFDEFDIEKNIQPAEYDRNFKKTIWKNVLHSNAESKRALQVEKQLDNDVKIGKFSYNARGENVVRMHSKEYSREYNRRLNGQIADQIRIAIKLIANAVCTAWVDAGKPKLSVGVDAGSRNAQDVNVKEEVNVNKNIKRDKNRNANRKNINKNEGAGTHDKGKTAKRKEEEDNNLGGAVSNLGKKMKYAGVVLVPGLIYYIRRKKKKKGKNGNGSRKKR